MYLWPNSAAMDLTTLTAISPVDGRYRHHTRELASYFSEYALMKYRVMVEVEYFIALTVLPLPQLAHLQPAVAEELRGIYRLFCESDARRIKEIEETTNHDVKAVEYFLKDRFEEFGLGAYKEFIHFGLTSQDINNTAIPLSLLQASEEVFFPVLNQVRERLRELAERWAQVPMLAQPTASRLRLPAWARS